MPPACDKCTLVNSVRMLLADKQNPNSFYIRHTCGDVEYDSTAFKQANADCVPASMGDLLKHSLCQFIKEDLFKTDLSSGGQGVVGFAQWKPPDTVMGQLQWSLDQIARMVQPTEARSASISTVIAALSAIATDVQLFEQRVLATWDPPHCACVLALCIAPHSLCLCVSFVYCIRPNEQGHPNDFNLMVSKAHPPS